MEYFNFTDAYCIKHFGYAFSPVLRVMQLYHVVSTVLAIWAILHFFLRFRAHFVLHPNIRILFTCQFIACLIHSTFLGAFQAHHFYTSLTTTEPCGVILAPSTYLTFQLPFAVSLFCIEFSEVMMLIERCVASYFFAYYEKVDTRLGHLLLFFAIFIPAMFAYMIYSVETYETPYVSALTTPKTAANLINGLFSILIFLNICGLVISSYLYHYNKKQQKRASFVLSSRYQSNENLTSSKMLTMLTTMQLVIFLVYGVSQFSFRIFFTNEFYATDIAQSLIILGYTPPLYCLALPLISMIFIKQSQKERSFNILSLVQVKSTGREGWRNYSQQLAQQWN
ncbi:unnamed protein product [Caenorhabditis auriculariae]|uniref:Uncharacterized protein n=1 Tax=Caenorhabditis auriculariae TaxID=2777116 RepID=A0A8S1HNG5_9PELO|nr:unnamed protein product [Caenorhabditis auriculariae]